MEQIIFIFKWLGIAIVVIVVVIFFALYFLGTFRERIKYRAKNVPAPNEPRFPLALASLSNSLTTTGVTTGFWVEADELQSARLEAIASAKRTIHFETFFMTPGRRANDFAAAIAERAAAGVDVQLIVDSYGVKEISKKYWSRLQKAGVEVHFFNSFDWKAPTTYAGRTHRKLLLIDGEVGLIGGAGISDYWDGLDKIGDTAPWFDFEFRVEGTVVAVLEGVFMQHWTLTGGTADFGKHIFNPERAEEELMLVTPGDDPSYRSSSVRALFQGGILASRKRVWLASPYFLPDRKSRQELINTHNTGVEVRILTTGSRSDKKFVYYASTELYGELLKAGIEIYEYQPSMLHAKILLIDDLWVSTGSANFDPRSFFHNDELDISTADQVIVENIQHFFELGLSRSKRVNLADWRKRSWRDRLVGRLVLFFQWQL
ncbi:MAG: phosphatidylserine/phosphatidylglycerophosphate/cardiolipin synthase family protein [Kastovskya adunca ATA6-11-RM4]|jgi:cardiolipin synthase|nr:phosphatidylserine/phosphatidylglycerophosphate/cardiolipin synthase family protein [Kastovskya adunca ATA6-11-RM4]